MLRKVTETMNTTLATLKEEFGEEIDELPQRLKRLEDEDEFETERIVIDGEMPVAPGKQLNVIVRN